MASVIAKYENDGEHPPSSFDVIEQLEKYAPEHTVEEQEQTPTRDSSSSRHSKRKRGDDNPLPASLHSTTGEIGPTPALDLPFEIQPSPIYGTNLEQSQEAYEATMQFIRSMSYGQNAPVGAGSVPSNQINSTGHEMLFQAPAASSSQELPPVDFMKIVDWDASLQNLQDSQHLLFGNQDPALGTDDFFDRLLPNQSPPFNEDGTYGHGQ